MRSSLFAAFAFCVLLAPVLAAAQLPSAVPSVETADLPGASNSSDDPALWVHPSDPGLSTLVTTHKGYGIGVYDLSGQPLQSIPSGDMNNVDLRYGFPLGAAKVDLVVATERGDNVLLLWAVDPATRLLADIAARPLPVGIANVYGVCMYRSPVSGLYYVFATSENGEVEQWELFDDGNGRVDGRAVRLFDVGGIAEGCVADDEHALFYIGEENSALWRYGAEPDAGEARVKVDAVEPDGNLVKDIEGLAIYYASEGGGYLLASSQGSSSYAVYSRSGGNDYLFSFELGAGNGIDAVTRTDGIDVGNFPLGSAFPSGVFIAHDDSNDDGHENFKLVPWPEIAALVDPPLAIDPARDPRGQPASCDDGVECTLDSGDPADDSCVHTPQDELCSNGQFCDGAESCDAALGCQSGAPVACDDGVECTHDQCDEAADACSSVADDAQCGDGLWCNGAETCDPALDCQPGSDPCPGRTCDEAADACGCGGHAECDDALFCTGVERCESGSCVAGTALDCDDGMACTADLCREDIVGCENVPDHGLCSNGQFCDGTESCDLLLGCQPGAPVICSDGVDCTLDQCDESADACAALPDDASCTDGLWCNGAELCDARDGCLPGADACSGLACDEAEQACEVAQQELVLEETQVGGSSASGQVSTSSDLLAGDGQLYLAAISSKPHSGVAVVSGLGLEWSEVRAQCAGRSQTGISLWMALGAPTHADVVTAEFESVPGNAVIGVARYSGVSQDEPLAAVGSANSNGPEGGCSGGSDTADWFVGLGAPAGERAFGAVAIRNRSNAPGAGQAQLELVAAGSGGQTAALALQERLLDSSPAGSLDGRLSRDTDWAVVAVGIRAGAGGGAGGGCADDAACDDGQFCNGQETCAAGVCNAGSPPGCDDGVGCTLDACNAAADTCESTPDDGACDDGLFCNGSETCSAIAGCQVGVEACAGQSCDESADVCETPPSGPLVLEQLETGGASSSSQVETSSDLAAAAGQLYLASIASKPFARVESVDGLALDWHEVLGQCGGRGQTGVSLWMAQGVPAGDGLVRASLEKSVANAVIAVSRYSGVSQSQPLGSAGSANTNGASGACQGG